MNRKQFTLPLAVSALALGLGMPKFAFSRDAEPRDWPNGFADWIKRYQIAPSGLCRYYRGGHYNTDVSTVATAFAVLFFVQYDVTAAERLATALIAEQAKHFANPHVSGGLPSAPLDAHAPFYSSDALITLQAMLSLHRATGKSQYLRSADGLYRFIMRLVQGDRLGILDRNFGFPVTYVTKAGAYNNVLTVNVGMLFFSALAEYGHVRSDRDALSIYSHGRKFLLQEAQSSHGPFYNSYDPGYPPKPYSRSRWKWYSHANGRDVLIGDNVLASALGALKMGGVEQADRVAEWLKPQHGAIYGYLDARTAAPAFLPTDKPYYDIVVTGMYADLMRQLHRMSPAIERDVLDTLGKARSKNGGWYWGQYTDGTFIDNAEALITGYWAVRAATGTT